MYLSKSCKLKYYVNFIDYKIIFFKVCLLRYLLQLLFIETDYCLCISDWRYISAPIIVYVLMTENIFPNYCLYIDNWR